MWTWFSKKIGKPVQNGHEKKMNSAKFVKIDDQGSIELISAIGKGVRFRNRESVKNVLEFVEKLFDEMQEGDNENQN